MGKPNHSPVWSTDAEQDPLSIWRYGADEWSSTATDDHLRKISRACARLLESRELGRARDELIHGLRSISVDPHIVFYRISMKAGHQNHLSLTSPLPLFVQNIIQLWENQARLPNYRDLSHVDGRASPASAARREESENSRRCQKTYF